MVQLLSIYIKRGVENSCPRTQHVHATKSPGNLHSTLESLPWSVLEGVTCANTLLPRSVQWKTRKWPSAIFVLWRKYTDFCAQQRRQCRSSGQCCHVQPGMQSTRKPPVQGHSVGSTLRYSKHVGAGQNSIKLPIHSITDYCIIGTYRLSSVLRPSLKPVLPSCSISNEDQIVSLLQCRHFVHVRSILEMIQWNLPKTTACVPVLTDHYREVAALQRLIPMF